MDWYWVVTGSILLSEKYTLGMRFSQRHFLGQCFSIAIIDKYLIPDSTLQLYAEPNKGIMLNAYNNKTDIVFTFRPEKEITYDFRNQQQHTKIISEQFFGMGWRSAELQKELLNARSFYLATIYYLGQEGNNGRMP
ncbi:hypothetical protein MUK70_10955 [Dyadobacter chenwenxiniae]|uniref:Uncharacterized protein n=1 Tax=Dyadobacter chenwenxiniae TaxID=2906456 RepID=A0A9X1TPJ7_9BACT|nr:hypothetical protein [Dyadobacter chenwenxiniae]MCF0065593.1 hypothetical protein [Dyadobacter chenwenxiniae]UON85504.1 hypothetical protein MUK70_10955 [Dyadobacter chenwenxiniae]